MAIVNSDFLSAVLTNFKAIFTDSFDNAGTQWAEIAGLIDGISGDKVTLDWLGQVPKMREWAGNKIVYGAGNYTFTINIKDFEATIGVLRKTMEDDQLGLIKPKVQKLGSEAQRYKDELIFNLLANGYQTKCYDGQYFFSASHSEGDSGTQSNLGTSALSASTLKTARVAMAKFLGDKRKNLGAMLDTLVVPPDLEDTADELLNSDILLVTGLVSTSSGSTAPAVNVLKGKARRITSPLLTDTTDWFGLYTKDVIKGLYLLVKKDGNFVASDNPYSDAVFDKQEFKYSAEARYGAGYGMWQYAYGAHL